MIGLLLSIFVQTLSNSIPIDLRVVAGIQAQEGQIATVEYRVETFGGKVWADTKTRGIPFELELSKRNQTLLDDWVFGMTVGSVRAIFIPAADMQNMIAESVMGQTDLLLTIELVGLRPTPSIRKL